MRNVGSNGSTHLPSYVVALTNEEFKNIQKQTADWRSAMESWASFTLACLLSAFGLTESATRTSSDMDCTLSMMMNHKTHGKCLAHLKGKFGQMSSTAAAVGL